MWGLRVGSRTCDRSTCVAVMHILVGPPRGVFVALPCPRTGRHKRFLLNQDAEPGQPQLFELLKVKPSSTASYFVDQSVVSSGGLLVASVYDPLFLLLPLLVATEGTEVTFDSLLQSAARSPQLVHVLRCLRARFCDALLATCDVVGGGDAISLREAAPVFRLSRAKTVAVLERRTRRLAAEIGAKADAAAKRLREVNNAFFTVSSMSTSADPRAADASAAVTGPAAPSAAAVTSAFGCICEYLSEPWAAPLAVACGMADASSGLLESSAAASAAPGSHATGSDKAAAWNAVGTDDTASVMAKYMSRGGGDEDRKRKAGGTPAAAPSAAQKRLATVNKAGMRTMQSFFK